jgi:hypothetical protein
MENNHTFNEFNFSINELPKVISETVIDIEKIEKQIYNAKSKAEAAKRDAAEASTKKAGLSFLGKNNKEAIVALQKTSESQSEALSHIVDAIKDLFEEQEKMANAMRYLFALGAMNIAANRMVVRELELKLKNASKERLSDAARQELRNVILQLRAQEDIQNKLNRHGELLKECNEQLNAFKEDISTFKENCIDTLRDVTVLKNEASEKMNELEEKFKHHVDGIRTDFSKWAAEQKECLAQFSCSLESSLNEKFSNSLSETRMRIEDLERFKQEELSSRTFFETRIYRIIVGGIAILALACSIIL